MIKLKDYKWSILKPIGVGLVIGIQIALIVKLRSLENRLNDYSTSCNSVTVIESVAEPKNVTLTIIDKTEIVEVEQWESLGNFKLTAYCPCEECCGKTDGITASGTKATAGRTIGVDPKVIPYGTKVMINDHEYIAEDTGVIDFKHIDIYFDSHAEALEFGVQEAEVFIKKGS